MCSSPCGRSATRRSSASASGPTRALFAVVTIVGLYLTGKGFGMYRGRRPDRRSGRRRPGRRHITEALMLPACIFVAAAYLPGDIKRVLKHPMLVGVKTWAVAHLIANGDLGGIILFGSVLAWAVYDRISLKRRSDPGGPPIPIGGLAERHRGGDRRHHPLSRARPRVPSAGGRAAGVRNAGVRNLTCRRHADPLGARSGSPRPTSAPARAASRSSCSRPITPTRRASSTSIATSSWSGICSAW